MNTTTLIVIMKNSGNQQAAQAKRFSARLSRSHFLSVSSSALRHSSYNSHRNSHNTLRSVQNNLNRHYLQQHFCLQHSTRRTFFTSSPFTTGWIAGVGESVSNAISTLTSPSTLFAVVRDTVPTPAACYGHIVKQSHDVVVAFTNTISSSFPPSSAADTWATVVSASDTAASAVAESSISAVNAVSSSSSCAGVEAVVDVSIAAASGDPTVPALYLAMICFGLAVRLCALPLSLYGDRAVARMVVAGPELHNAFCKYAEVVEHQTVRREDVTAALLRMRSRRKRILLKHRTSNIKMLLPPIMGTLWLSSVGVAAAVSVIPGLVHAWAVNRAALLSNAPIATSPPPDVCFTWWLQPSAALSGLPDPTAAIALALIAHNIQCGVSRRIGFGDGKDKKMRRNGWLLATTLRTTACFSLIYPVVASPVILSATTTAASASAGSASSGTVAGLTTYLTCAGNANVAVLTVGWGGAVYGALTALGPFLLGVSLGGLVQVLLNRHLPHRIKKRWLSWPTETPRAHGRYGAEVFNPREHMAIDYALDTERKKRDMDYERNMRIVEGDCDRQLKKMGQMGKRILQRYGEADLKPRDDLMITQRPV